MSNIKVIVCCHKKDVCATQEPYFPIHVGKELHPDIDLGIQEDNQGENISAKNASYCELTGMYWAWKNLKNVDIIGLCHYRRYFDFHNICRPFIPFDNFNEERFKDIDLSIPNDIIIKVSDGQVVVARPIHYRVSLATDYCMCHISDDFRTLRQVIKDTQSPEFVSAFNKVMYQSNELLHYNMFLMRWQDFDEYCTWLFGILAETEKRIDITHYNPVQKRIFGYMAERLFNVWLYAKSKRLIKKPILKICDDKPFTNPFRHKIRTLRADLASWLQNARFYNE